jgi:hypothetical protein
VRQENLKTDQYSLVVCQGLTLPDNLPDGNDLIFELGISHHLILVGNAQQILNYLKSAGIVPVYSLIFNESLPVSKTSSKNNYLEHYWICLLHCPASGDMR